MRRGPDSLTDLPPLGMRPSNAEINAFVSETYDKFPQFKEIYEGRLGMTKDQALGFMFADISRDTGTTNASGKTWQMDYLTGQGGPGEAWGPFQAAVTNFKGGGYDKDILDKTGLPLPDIKDFKNPQVSTFVKGRVEPVVSFGQGARPGEVRGYSVHAGVSVRAGNKNGRRRVVRDCARPPFAAQQSPRSSKRMLAGSKTESRLHGLDDAPRPALDTRPGGLVLTIGLADAARPTPKSRATWFSWFLVSASRIEATSGRCFTETNGTNVREQGSPTEGAAVRIGGLRARLACRRGG